MGSLISGGVCFLFDGDSFFFKIVHKLYCPLLILMTVLLVENERPQIPVCGFDIVTWLAIDRD